ncbi:hypothetical protein [Leptothermofonsia sp. ETS-13]|uniref:hypothetical protein n=1 Tax=Leptothermofonsia sp. ETS-13 TaxID=3035696 RepID=UPI003B9E5550
MKQWRTAWYPKAPSTPIAWHPQMGHSMSMSEDQIKAMRMDMDLGTVDDGVAEKQYESKRSFEHTAPISYSNSATTNEFQGKSKPALRLMNCRHPWQPFVRS